MLRELFCCEFNFIVHGFLVPLIPAAAAEESVVNLLATVEQNRRRDDGHESLSFLGSFVRPWTNPDRHNLGRCLTIVEPLPPLPHIRAPTTVCPGEAQDAWWFHQLKEVAKAPRIGLSLFPGGEEPVCFATCDGEELRPLSDTDVADAATVYQIKIVAKAIASGTPGRTERSVQCSTVKHIRLDADNGTDDVRTMLNDYSILVDGVDKLHCAAVEHAEASKGRNVQQQQDLDDNFYGELIELTGGETGGDGCAIVSAIVEWTASLKGQIVHGIVAVRLCPA